MDRRKFTYRYDEETEELLDKAMKKLGFSSMNKLIDKLIQEALVNLPKEIKENESKINTISKSLQKAETERDKALNDLFQLKSLITQERDIKKKIEDILNK